MKNYYVLGVDYGSDSVRVIAVDIDNGDIVAESVAAYPRWANGLYCNPAVSQFRQHPADYLESIQQCITEIIKTIDKNLIKAIAVDTTGSTPVAVDKNLVPLCMYPEFADEPDAMFLLWKDHTSCKEAELITNAAKKNNIDYTKYCGGSYSPEWFWAKLLNILKNDAIKENIYSFVEHSDWIASVLTGITDSEKIIRNRCSAAHKAMWHTEFGGYPDAEFWNTLNSKAADVRSTMNNFTVTAGSSIGTLSVEWAKKLGLNTDVTIATCMLDAHSGAIGAGIKNNSLIKIIGTSTCDILIDKSPDLPLVKGIAGQAEGSLLEGYTGFEAGQSAFGDLLNWFVSMFTETGKNIGVAINKNDVFKHLESQLYNRKIVRESATDWINGRRSPDPDFSVNGMINGLTIGSSVENIYQALCESLCFGSKAICNRFEVYGIRIDSIIALGGIPGKSPALMQMLADILEKEIHIVNGSQTCALGAAMCAASGAGFYSDLETASANMNQGNAAVFIPNASNREYFRDKFQKYSENF